MSTHTYVDPPERTFVPPTHRLTFAGLVRCELIKLVTVRSLVALLVIAVTLTAALSITVAILTDPDAQKSAVERIPAFVNTTLVGLQLSIFLVAVIGAVAGASDFGNGTIGLAFGAAPRRVPVLGAKLVAVSGASVALVGATLLLTAIVCWLALTPGPLWTPVVNPTAVFTLIGAVIAVTGVSMSAISLGCLLRSSAGAVFAILGLLIVLTIALMAVPSHLVSPAVSDYSFGGAVTTLLALADEPGTWIGAVVALTVWTAALAGGAAMSMQRRDV